MIMCVRPYKKRLLLFPMMMIMMMVKSTSSSFVYCDPCCRPPRLYSNHDVGLTDRDQDGCDDNERQKETSIPRSDLSKNTKVIRVKRARRMNHAFQYLYRHDDIIMDVKKGIVIDHRDDTSKSYIDAQEYLVQSGGFSDDEVKRFQDDFPPLLTLDIERHLKPKMKFLKYSLGGGSERGQLSTLGKSIPPQYFGTRLERTIAPRHAFLMAMNLPHGSALLENNCFLLSKFLSARSSKQFANLCNQWRKEFLNVSGGKLVFSKDIDEFETVFRRGLMAAARNELSYVNQGHDSPIIDAGKMIKLLVSNGGNPLELDIRGISLIHWASGTGNISGVKALMPYFGGVDEAIQLRASRDGASILHWAATGAKQKDFGCGGHIDLVSWFIDIAKSLNSSNNKSSVNIDTTDFFIDEGDANNDVFASIINAVTDEGNSVLMWAAWSKSFDVVKLLLDSGADTQLRNKNGCTVAHWVASGGDLEICKYLAEYALVDFDVVNYNGNSPLSHAVAFGRSEVVAWLKNELLGKNGDDGRAALLAKDFVEWEGDENEKRKEILKMFDFDFI